MESARVVHFTPPILAATYFFYEWKKKKKRSRGLPSAVSSGNGPVQVKVNRNEFERGATTSWLRQQTGTWRASERSHLLTKAWWRERSSPVMLMSGLLTRARPSCVPGLAEPRQGVNVAAGWGSWAHQCLDRVRWALVGPCTSTLGRRLSCPACLARCNHCPHSPVYEDSMQSILLTSCLRIVRSLQSISD
jgi:hypothetical protein